MNKSLKKSVARAALVAVLALGGAGAASAEQTGPTTVTVPPRRPGIRNLSTTSNVKVTLTLKTANNTF
jgi:hypothetical protein